MRLLRYFAVLYPFAFLCSAYDNYDGLGRLRKACFPVYDRNECNRTVPRKSGSYKGATSNSPSTKIFLFTPSSHDRAEQLHPCGGGLPYNTTFDVRCPTEVFIHGGTDGVCRSAWMREMKEQLFLRSNCYNIILVDWTWGNFPDGTSAYNAIVVGEQMGYVLKKIARQTGYDCKKFHVTGHSLGVIAASHAGKHMQRKCRMGRLTSLEGASTSLPMEKYLKLTDALFVDTIHTDVGDCVPFSYGNPRPLGHVNFYVNDGVHQYSCIPYGFESLLKLDFGVGQSNLLNPPLCSHNQAIEYYKASILANTDDTLLIGVQCDSYDDWIDNTCERNCEEGEGKCLPMGLDTSSYVGNNDMSESKTYYVPTTLTCPYADHSGFTGLPLTPINEQDPPL